MGFRIGAYATVWEIKDGSGNWTDVKLSISKKNRYTGEYEDLLEGQQKKQTDLLQEPE